MRPDFTNKSYYPFEIRQDKNVIAGGYFNEKAWNKTIENDVLWEYILDNGRVIEKPLDINGKPDMSSAEIQNGTIVLNWIDETSAENNVSTADVLSFLENVIKQRKKDMPENSYTTHLFQKGEEKILKKMGEECIEVILAKDNDKDIIYESADLIYHLMVYLVYKNIPFEDILKELKSRF